MSFNDFSLSDWLFYLENSQSDEIQLGLNRVGQVASALHLLEPNATVITVAGTNGKGSTVATLEAIYGAAGYRVASYTSPHLLHFNERIRINQQPISDESLCAAFSAVEQHRHEVHLTYFEMATLAALYYFKQYPLDVIILEVGMGGRLDATNIIAPDLAIITTIDFDHQEYLGDTKDAIGYEKAGILRKNIPCIYADIAPPVTVLNEVARQNVALYALNQQYSFHSTKDKFMLSLPSGEVVELPLPKINFKAAAAAMIASQCLSCVLPIQLDDWHHAMEQVTILARQQVVKGGVTTVFDVAHNPQAVTLLAKLIRSHPPKGKVHAVFSGLKDKDICGLIKPMQSIIDFWYPALLNGKRAASEHLLLSALQAENCTVSLCYNDPRAAYKAAIQCAKPNDMIVVYGSFLTVSAVMSAA